MTFQRTSASDKKGFDYRVPRHASRVTEVIPFSLQDLEFSEKILIPHQM
jgi:hypothetical protein